MVYYSIILLFIGYYKIIEGKKVFLWVGRNFLIEIVYIIRSILKGGN